MIQVSWDGTRFVPEAGHQMVIDHTDGLHEGVDDGGADKAEAVLFERFEEGLGNGRLLWQGQTELKV